VTDDQKRECHSIIHSASTAAAGVGAGLAQIPLADSAVITPIQVAMIIRLGQAFNVQLSEAVAKGIALGMVSMYVGRSVSQVLLGWIPGIGNAINAGTAAALTEAIGWAVVSKFDRGEVRD